MIVIAGLRSNVIFLRELGGGEYRTSLLYLPVAVVGALRVSQSFAGRDGNTSGPGGGCFLDFLM